MCSSANGTSDPADAQSKEMDTRLDSPGIIAMNFEASGKPVGTGKLVELNAGEQVIIKILRNGIAKVSG